MAALTYMRGGALGGVGSGVLATALELAILQSPDAGWRLGLTLAGTIIPAFIMCGAVLGLSLALLTMAGRGLARRVTGGRPDLAAGALTAALVSAPIFLLVKRLSAGRQASQLLGPLAVKLTLVIAAALLCGAALWGALKLARWLRRVRAWFPCLVAGILLVALTIAAFVADAFLFRRLYEYLHQLLMLVYLISGLLATLCLGRSFHREAGRKRLPEWALRGAALLLAGGVIGGGWLARWTLENDQRLRFTALELTTVTARVLSLVPLDTRTESPLFLDAVIGRSVKGDERFHVRDANVVMVTVDALRADHLGFHGYERRTSPNIDALARSAVAFEGAYCQAPLTCYSIPSLLTGDYLKSTLPLLSSPPPTLAQILGARGYTTAAFYNASIFYCDDKRATSYGKRKFGFETASTELRNAEDLTDQVLKYLRGFRESGKKKLFMWVHYFDVHEPYRRRPGYDFGPRNLDRYDSEIAYTDNAFGRLIAALHQLDQPTILVLTSDHGEEFKEHGGNYHGSSLYEEQIRVPLIIGVPGLKPRVVKSPSQLVDVVPTVLSLLDIPVPGSVRGRSLVPELLGQGNPGRTAFSEVHTKKMVRFRHWKLIHNFRRSTNELYDLLTDPRERINLIGRRPRELAQLKSLLHGWFDQLQAVGDDRQEVRPAGIDLGRIGDRRAVPLLSRLIIDPSAASRWRVEAARLIGQLQDRQATDALWLAVADDDRQVADEAAIALGELKDPRARVVLPRVLTGTDLKIRTRAGIALARVDSPAATPALLEAMYSRSWEVQNRAAHYLGFVGDRRAIAPLLSLARHLHLRSRIALALGRIGRRHRDERILGFLLDLVRKDGHSDVRQRGLGGLGYLRDRRAIRPLVDLLANEPDLSWTPETLSRLGGVGGFMVPGLDFTPLRRGLKDGWGRCVKSRSTSSDHYLGSTWCAMVRPQARVQFTLRRRPFPAQLMLRFRSLDDRTAGARLTLQINGRKLAPIALSRGWSAVRISTGRRHWRLGANDVRFLLSRTSAGSGEGLAALDYLILAPRARSGGGRRKTRR